MKYFMHYNKDNGVVITVTSVPPFGRMNEDDTYPDSSYDYYRDAVTDKDYIEVDQCYGVLDYYVNTETKELMPIMEFNINVDKDTITANDIDISTLSNIPVGCSVNVKGTDYPMENSQLQFGTQDFGDYIFIFSMLHYKTKTITIKALKS